MEKDPLSSTMDTISYQFTMPVPRSLLSTCPPNFGFEIFTYSEQVETEDLTYPVIAIVESQYDETTQTLTATVYPQVWVDRTARFIISCTPGGSNVRKRRRRLQMESMKVTEMLYDIESTDIFDMNETEIFDFLNDVDSVESEDSIQSQDSAQSVEEGQSGQSQGGDESEYNSDSNDNPGGSIWENCPASELSAPIETARDPLFNKFSRNHVGIGYYVYDQPIYAVANGTVLRARSNKWWGNWLVLKHNDGMLP